MPGPVVSRWKLSVYWFVLGALFTLTLTAVIFFTGWRRWEQRREENRPQPVKYSRNEFSHMVLGKTESEVLHAAGEPDQTSADSEAQYWHYHQRTVDPVTNETDSDVQLVIQKGKVIALNY